MCTTWEDVVVAELASSLESDDTVGWLVMLAMAELRRMLGPHGWWMLEALEGVLDVSGHGDIAGALVVVPIDGETTVAAAGPVLAHLVLLFECRHEVLGVGCWPHQCI